MKKTIYLLLLFITYFSFAQELEAPHISHQSGFYENEFQVTISHPDPTVTILYTLDGSEPRIENLTGKEWSYKTYYPTNPGDPFGELLKDTIWTYVYSGPLEVKDRTLEKGVVSAITTSPFIQAPYYTEDAEPFKGTVLRVKAHSFGDTSKTITKTYFISEKGKDRYNFSILSLSMDNDKMYGYENGLNVPGIDFDNWRNENPLIDAPSLVPSNYRRKGKSTEFQAHLTFLLKGEEKLNHGFGLRMNGNYSRSYPNRSIRMYAKSEYGEKNFKHPFFDKLSDNKFKRLILRNSGNDIVHNFFRDAMIHDMTRNLNFSIQESLPIVLFINGEYDGIRNLRERYDTKYFESKFGIHEDSLDFFDNIGVIKEGDTIFHDEMFDFFLATSLKEEADYQKATEYIDPINYGDYLITNIFLSNSDWLHNNYLFFRKKTSYNPNSLIAEADGRFRWILKDMDVCLDQTTPIFSFNLLKWALRAEDTISYFSPKQTIIFRRLIENDSYRTYFINRFSDIMNTTLKKERMLDFAETYDANYSVETFENIKRWTFVQTTQSYNEGLAKMMNFINVRENYQRDHIRSVLEVGDNQELTLDVSDEEHGYIHLNTIDILSTTDGIDEEVYPWSGTYFEGVPVTLTAIPNSGYIFSHWSGMVNDTSSILVLDLDETKYIKANFIPEDDSSVDALTMNEEKLKVYPNPFKDELNVLADYYYGEYFVYSLEGKEVQHGEFNSSKIHLGELPKGMYILKVVANNSVQTVRILKT